MAKSHLHFTRNYILWTLIYAEIQLPHLHTVVMVHFVLLSGFDVVVMSPQHE